MNETAKSKSSWWQALLILGVLVGGVAVWVSRQGGPTPVPWKNYYPGLQAELLGKIDTKQCVVLQQDFDRYELRNSFQMNKYGSNNAALMRFILDEMTRIGCFSKNPPVVVVTTLPSGKTAGVDYQVIDRVDLVQGGQAYDLLFPQLKPGEPVAVSSCTSVALQLSAKQVSCYSSAKSREANLSASYSVAHPGVLEAGYLGSWSANNGFEAPILPKAIPSRPEKVKSFPSGVAGQVVGVRTPWPEGNLSIRKSPLKSAVELGRAADGEVMDVLGSIEGWFKVKSRRTGVAGWVSGKYFDLCPCTRPVVTDPDLEAELMHDGVFTDEGEAAEVALPGSPIGVFPLSNGLDAEFTYEPTNTEVGAGSHGSDLVTVSYWIRAFDSGNQFRTEWQIDCGEGMARYVLTDSLNAVGEVVSTRPSTSDLLTSIDQGSPNDVVSDLVC